MKKQFSVVSKYGNVRVVIFIAFLYLFISVGTVSAFEPYSDMIFLETHGKVEIILNASGSYQDNYGCSVEGNISARKIYNYTPQGLVIQDKAEGVFQWKGDRQTHTFTYNEDEVSRTEYGKILIIVSPEEQAGYFSLDSFGMNLDVEHIIKNESSSFTERGELSLRAELPSYSNKRKLPKRLPLTVEGSWDGKRLAGTYTQAVKGSFTAGSINIVTLSAPGNNSKLTGTVTVNWELGEPAPERKMIIQPFNDRAYQEWIPLPGYAEYDQINGRQLKFTASIELEDEREGELIGDRIDFWLNDVSRHQGKSTNYPLKYEAASDENKERLCY